MKYRKIEQAVFLARPNRFIAHVEVNGRQEVSHVKNTGRCKELLVPGCTVYLETAVNPNRKTAYDLVAVQKGDRLINMDSQSPNAAVKEWLERGNYFHNITVIRPEITYGDSRFDFYLEADGKKIFMEVKGVTLEEDGIVRFPDAPTARGVKHMKELMGSIKEGYEAYIFFVIQMKGVKWMEPNDVTHPAFGEMLRKAAGAGVHVLAYDCRVEPDFIAIDEPVQVRLDR